MKLDAYFIPYTKINSKSIKDLSIKLKAIKLLEENIQKQFHDTGIDNDFLDVTPKAQATKTKINKWDLIKLKNFLHSKGNLKQNEKTTHRMGENIHKDVTHKGLILISKK